MPANSLAEYCITKTWALGLSVNTSKAELPYGFKRLQLPCYSPNIIPPSPLPAGAAEYPTSETGSRGCSTLLCKGQTGKLWN